MKRALRWLPALAVVVVVAAGVTAWRIEAAVPSGSPTAARSRTIVTPVLSARRLPTVVAGPIAGRRLRTDLDALAQFLPADSCLVVAGPDGLRYDRNGATPLVPASAAKLATATAALEVLGEGTRFRTSVVAAAPVGSTIPGDLTLVGGGDPLLATADYAGRFERQPQTFTDLAGLAASVAAAGVRRVEGAVVGDEGRYDLARYVDGWPARYLDQRVIGPLSALSVNDGFARYPTVGSATPLEPAPEPAVEAAAVLTRLLEERGVEVVGAPRAGPAPAGATIVASIESPPLEEVVAQLLRESDNNTAELLTKEIGLAYGAPSTEGGLAAMGEVLDGVPHSGGLASADGSGLSPQGRASCDALVALLDRAGTGSAITDRLPVAGRSGTLMERFVGTPLEGAVRAKTGTLTSVASLAGVVADDDPPLRFALVVNTPPPTPVPPGVGDLQRQIAEVLLDWPRVPDPAALGPLKPDG